MPASAGVFGSLALTASVEIKLEPKILRLAFGGLLELHDEIVAFAIWQFCFTDKRIAFFLKLQLHLAILGVGLNRRILGSDGNRLHFVVVKIDGYRAIFLNHELSVWFGLFKQSPSFGRGFVAVVMFLLGDSRERDARKQKGGKREDAEVYFHVFYVLFVVVLMELPGNLDEPLSMA